MNSLVAETLKTKEKKTTKTKKPSPYKEFNNWLLNSAPHVMPSDEILKNISPRVVLVMLGKYPNITIFMNEHFNNWGLFYFKPEEFFLFVRQIVRKYRLTTLYNKYASESKEKSLTEIHNYFPYLKREEVFNLLEVAKEDEEFPALMESLGIATYKSKKVKKTKNETKEFKKVEKPKKVKEEKIDSTETITINDLKGMFINGN